MNHAHFARLDCLIFILNVLPISKSECVSFAWINRVMTAWHRDQVRCHCHAWILWYLILQAQPCIQMEFFAGCIFALVKMRIETFVDLLSQISLIFCFAHSFRRFYYKTKNSWHFCYFCLYGLQLRVNFFWLSFCPFLSTFTNYLVVFFSSPWELFVRIPSYFEI